MSRLEFTIGTRKGNSGKTDGKSEWLSRDYSASISLDVTDPNQKDIRGKDGISTDKIRAKHIKDEIFEIDEGTLPKRGESQRYTIDFPSNEVLSHKDIYVELAARAIMQSVWFDFDINIPGSIPRISKEDMDKIFAIEPHGPLRRRIVIGKLIDAFMVDPKKPSIL